MAGDFEIALYYPYIEIQDIGLLKTAALYWDKIQTIFPYDKGTNYNFENFSNPKIYKEAESAGFYERRLVYAHESLLKIVGSEFLNAIQKESVIIKEIGYRKGCTERITTKPLNIEKMHPEHLEELNRKLRDVGFYSFFDGECIHIPSFLVDAYMSWLASTISQADGSVPLADELLWQNIMLEPNLASCQERIADQAKIANMSLQTISIHHDVPLDAVIKFRDKHRDELINFRRSIRKLSKQIGIGLNTSKKQEQLQEIIRDEVLPSKQEIEAKLTEGDIAFGFSALDITQATAMGMIASRGENLLAGVGAGLISLTISFVQSLREDRNIIREHPLGYLYRAQKKFGAKK